MGTDVAMRNGRLLDGALARMWSAVRFSSGMLILVSVFLVAHGLVLVHELTASDATERR